jgi:hypothetical protein
MELEPKASVPLNAEPPLLEASAQVSRVTPEGSVIVGSVEAPRQITTWAFARLTVLEIASELTEATSAQLFEFA